MTTPVSSSLAGTLPVVETICDVLMGADDAQVAMSWPIFSTATGTTVIANGDFSPLELFKNLTNIDLLGFLNNLTTVLNRISQLTEDGSGLLQQVPFVGQTLTSLVNVG